MRSNSKGFAPIFILTGVLIVSLVIGAVIYFSRDSGLSYRGPIPDPNETSIPSSTNVPAPSSWIGYVDSLDDALKVSDKIESLSLCDKGLATIPSTIGNLSKLEFLDLSENSLTTLPQEISKLKALKELILVDNKISASEQVKIKQQLPNTKIAFIPQKGFNPYIAENWKTYTSIKYGFSFKYQPELKVLETEDKVNLVSELFGFEQAFASCSIEKAYMNLQITLEENPNNLSPIQYLENIYKTKLTKKENEYFMNENEKQQYMFGYAKTYKQGDLEGIISDGGESEHPSVIVSHNGKFFELTQLPGGETGSKIPDIAKKTFEQTFATFKFAN